MDNVVVLPKQVIKRDGLAARFDLNKIRSAIAKGRSGQQRVWPGARRSGLSAQVVKVLIHRFGANTPSIEAIQDIVEQTLIAADYFQTARAFCYRLPRAARQAAA